MTHEQKQELRNKLIENGFNAKNFRKSYPNLNYEYYMGKIINTLIDIDICPITEEEKLEALNATIMNIATNPTIENINNVLNLANMDIFITFKEKRLNEENVKENKGLKRTERVEEYKRAEIRQEEDYDFAKFSSEMEKIKAEFEETRSAPTTTSTQDLSESPIPSGSEHEAGDNRGVSVCIPSSSFLNIEGDIRVINKDGRMETYTVNYRTLVSTGSQNPELNR